MCILKSLKLAVLKIGLYIQSLVYKKHIYNALIQVVLKMYTITICI